jgi:hypothetical protein
MWPKVFGHGARSASLNGRAADAARGFDSTLPGPR